MMAEWIGNLAETVAPKHVRKGHGFFAACRDCLVEESVGIRNIEVKIRGRNGILRRSGRHPRKFVADENNGIAYLQLGMVDSAIGAGHAKAFDSAERGFVKIDRTRCIFAGKSCGDGVKPFGDSTNF